MSLLVLVASKSFLTCSMTLCRLPRVSKTNKVLINFLSNAWVTKICGCKPSKQALLKCPQSRDIDVMNKVDQLNFAS